MHVYDKVRASRIVSVQGSGANPETLVITLTGGEKRTILRDDLLLGPRLRELHSDYYLAQLATPSAKESAVNRPYARRDEFKKEKADQDRDTSASDKEALGEQLPAGGGPVARNEQVPIDPGWNKVGEGYYPASGDYLVEDYDILTDTLIQKVYDAKTFETYFKMSIA